MIEVSDTDIKREIKQALKGQKCPSKTRHRLSLMNWSIIGYPWDAINESPRGLNLRLVIDAECKQCNYMTGISRPIGNLSDA